MIVYIEEYRKAIARKARLDTTYADELLCVNWNPVVAVTPITLNRPAPTPRRDPMDDIFFDVDMDAFMARVYALATQI